MFEKKVTFALQVLIFITDWHEYLRTSPQRWLWHYISWLKFSKKKHYILSLNKLQKDFYVEMQRLLDFLCLPLETQYLDCAKSNFNSFLQSDMNMLSTASTFLLDKNLMLTLSVYEQLVEKIVSNR